MDAANTYPDPQPDPQIDGELSGVILRAYPELAALTQDQTKQLAAAVYQLNRTAQIALETFSRSKPVQGLSRTTLPRLLGLIETSLHRIRISSEATRLTRFLSAEGALLAANRAQWPTLEALWWPNGAERISSRHR